MIKKNAVMVKNLHAIKKTTILLKPLQMLIGKKKDVKNGGLFGLKTKWHCNVKLDYTLTLMLPMGIQPGVLGLKITMKTQ